MSWVAPFSTTGTAQQILTECLVMMKEFVSRKNFFKFTRRTLQHISRTIIGNKFISHYVYIFMVEVENGFLPTQEFQPLLWLQYIDIFFIWTHQKEKLKTFILNSPTGLVKRISFLDLKGNAQFVFLCNPQKPLVNICLMKILKSTITKK